MPGRLLQRTDRVARRREQRAPSAAPQHADRRARAVALGARRRCRTRSRPAPSPERDRRQRTAYDGARCDAASPSMHAKLRSRRRPRSRARRARAAPRRRAPPRRPPSTRGARPRPARGVRTRSCRCPSVPSSASTTSIVLRRRDSRRAIAIHGAGDVGVAAEGREHGAAHHQRARRGREGGQPVQRPLPHHSLDRQRDRAGRRPRAWAARAPRGSRSRKSSCPANSTADRAPRCSTPSAWIAASAGCTHGIESQWFPVICQGTAGRASCVRECVSTLSCRVSDAN